MCCQHVLWQLWAVGFPALSESLPLTFGAVVPALPMLWQGCEGQRSNPERKEKGAALKGRRAVCNPWLLGLVLPKEGNCWGCQYNYLFFFFKLFSSQPNGSGVIYSDSETRRQHGVKVMPIGA